MARVRVFMVLVLALGAGGALAFATYNYIQQVPQQSATAIPTKAVVVAASDLDIGEEVSADKIRVINWPANAVPGWHRPSIGSTAASGRSSCCRTTGTARPGRSAR